MEASSINKIINAMYHDIKNASSSEERKNRMKRAMIELNDIVRLMSVKKWPEKEKYKQKILKLLKIWEEKYPDMFCEIFAEKYIEKKPDGKKVLKRKVGLRTRIQYAGTSVEKVDIIHHGSIYKMPVGKFPEIEVHVKNINKILFDNETELVYDSSKEISRDKLWFVGMEIKKLIPTMRKNNFENVPEEEKKQIKDYILKQLIVMKSMALPGDITDMWDYDGLINSFKNAG
jgi:hypothetical protein